MTGLNWVPIARVTGRSMEPTLHAGQVVLTRPVRRARRGDIVVARRTGARYLKRVVAGPGDVVEMEAGRVRVNGRSVDGRPRIRGASVDRRVVPPGHYFLVGDNGRVSDDSRSWADPFVPAADLQGRVVARA